jgi:hypothetical protein
MAELVMGMVEGGGALPGGGGLLAEGGLLAGGGPVTLGGDAMAGEEVALGNVSRSPAWLVLVARTRVLEVGATSMGMPP